MRRVFPKRKFTELDLKHPIFHCVFDLKVKPQVPAIQTAFEGRPYGITWEREDGLSFITRRSTTIKAV